MSEVIVTNDIKYVGVDDHEIDLFEGQYIVPNGMAYNSYVILDEKTAVLDGVDGAFSKQWIENIKAVLGEKEPDYLVVHHMEPDHSASIADFVSAFPQAKIVSNAKAFSMMENFFSFPLDEKKVTVQNGETLSLGKHSLTFVFAPMVHWPEVMVSYDSKDKVLFSADAFGKFGALDADEDWDCEARRYYVGIVGKFGVQAQALLKKAAELEIKTICPLHGPILKENLEHYIGKYQIWSSYDVETKGVMIAYTSVYGNTKKAAEILCEELKKRGCPKAFTVDLAREDMAEAVEDAFRHEKLVLATTTYNGQYFPFMKHFIEHLVDHNFQKRTVAFVENGTWAPTAAKLMKTDLEKCKNLTFCENTITVRSAVKPETEEAIKKLAEELWA
ncbi:MAG: MBL fold metallo-hydrolase [Clostridia bacterium]|nr:MBL fold metallo-hydrolase [Clostridia bacterium]